MFWPSSSALLSCTTYTLRSWNYRKMLASSTCYYWACKCFLANMKDLTLFWITLQKFLRGALFLGYTKTAIGAKNAIALIYNENFWLKLRNLTLFPAYLPFEWFSNNHIIHIIFTLIYSRRIREEYGYLKSCRNRSSLYAIFTLCFEMVSGC